MTALMLWILAAVAAVFTIAEGVCFIIADRRTRAWMEPRMRKLIEWLKETDV